jgi:hypothetical protein
VWSSATLVLRLSFSAVVVLRSTRIFSSAISTLIAKKLLKVFKMQVEHDYHYTDSNVADLDQKLKGLVGFRGLINV